MTFVLILASTRILYIFVLIQTFKEIRFGNLIKVTFATKKKQKHFCIQFAVFLLVDSLTFYFTKTISYHTVTFKES